MKKTYYSNGKLLLTAEYFVLDGANALAIPTTYGQALEVSSSEGTLLQWEGYDVKNRLWFKASFDVNSHLDIKDSSDHQIAKTLQEVLQQAKKVNPDYLSPGKGYRITTRLDFPRDWGLGTSSTLINNIAQWADVDAFELLRNSFGGSGYDLACAQNDHPVLFSNSQSPPLVQAAAIDWRYRDQLFFVFLNKKKNSKEAISHYKGLSQNKKEHITTINRLTTQFIEASSLLDFEKSIALHEDLISKLLQLQKVKDKLFADYPGAVKSLGAWGGDFVLATRKEALDYFPGKGFNIVVPFEEMIKKSPGIL